MVCRRRRRGRVKRKRTEVAVAGYDRGLYTMEAQCRSVPSQEGDREEVERVELRPGLVMIRRRTLKPDGRYLLYYDFERNGGGTGQEAG